MQQDLPDGRPLLMAVRGFRLVSFLWTSGSPSRVHIRRCKQLVGRIGSLCTLLLTSRASQEERHNAHGMLWAG